VVRALEGQEARAGDERGEVAPLVERHAQVAARVRDEARTRDATRFFLDVDVPERPEDAHRRCAPGR
jgi:hypothetical protein